MSKPRRNGAPTHGHSCPVEDPGPSHTLSVGSEGVEEGHRDTPSVMVCGVGVSSFTCESSKAVNGLSEHSRSRHSDCDPGTKFRVKDFDLYSKDYSIYVITRRELGVGKTFHFESL